MPYPDELYDKIPNLKGHHEVAEFLKEAIWEIRRIQSTVGTNTVDDIGNLGSRIRAVKKANKKLSGEMDAMQSRVDGMLDWFTKTIDKMQTIIYKLECDIKHEREYSKRVARIAIDANRRSIRNYWLIRRKYGRF